MPREDILIVPIDKLCDYHNQPFKVIDDASMVELIESVKTVGILVPLIVRETSDGLYEIISGHRRKHACKLAGLNEVPVIVKNLDDDESAIFLVDSNLQRENILPSERAYAYRLKLEAIKHQGKRSDLHESSFSEGSTDFIGLDADKSGRQIRRYIRLTELIYSLLQKVDDKLIPVNAGESVSYLNVIMQVILNDRLDFHDCGLSTDQGSELKKLYLGGTLDEKEIDKILKTDDSKINISIDYNKLKRFFPHAQSVKECKQALWDFLEKYCTDNCA